MTIALNITRGARRRMLLAALGIPAAAALLPLHAARAAADGPPYAAASHTTFTSCRGMASGCGANAAADKLSGLMNISSVADSGLNGNAPGEAMATATSQVLPAINIGNARTATFTFTVQVDRLEQQASGGGKAWVLMWANAACDRCETPEEVDVFPQSTGVTTVTITLHRPVDGGHIAHLQLAALADSHVGCDDFCVLTSGRAVANARMTVTHVETSLS